MREHQGVDPAVPSRGGLISDTVEDPGYRDATAHGTSRGFGDRVFASEATKNGRTATVELKWEALLNLLLKREVVAREEFEVEIELLKPARGG